ncbi:hypothetical protein ABTL28_19285, partial [Acinetobacter baumannii]
PPGAEGFIYVEFAHVETARIAAMALNGRKFADRSVVVQYVSSFFPPHPNSVSLWFNRDLSPFLV